jgi:hypothetical protein
MLREAELNLSWLLLPHPQGIRKEKLRSDLWWNKELEDYEYDEVCNTFTPVNTCQ